MMCCDQQLCDKICGSTTSHKIIRSDNGVGKSTAFCQERWCRREDSDADFKINKGLFPKNKKVRTQDAAKPDYQKYQMLTKQNKTIDK